MQQSIKQDYVGINETDSGETLSWNSMQMSVGERYDFAVSLPVLGTLWFMCVVAILFLVVVVAVFVYK